ncbi:MAG: 16S rRNA (adenine(1518)-N(6)/adenine(1519)-N(6))-dimethyltransferase RsmA [Armatimonadota bacterium]|nr:16S rRNA (adenine(1518)-N(6)/adenine(1519)-N(6))-dimethyltransferase RsmA [Armatimonadota bacterium]
MIHRSEGLGWLDLATPSAVQRLLKRFGLVPRKRLGQHFLTNRQALERIVAAAELSPQDAVLEVGAGLGALTWALAQRAGVVVAVEKDPGLIRILTELFSSSSNVHLVHGDILSLDLPSLFREGPSRAIKVVSNLPYYLASTLILRLLYADLEGAGEIPIERMVLTVQEEVGRRIVASPGTKEYSLLSVLVQYRAESRIVTSIPRSSFYPQPEVDSVVVRLDVYPIPPLQARDERLFVHVVRAAFGQRRKQLRNALLTLPAAGSTFTLGKEVIEEACHRSRIDPERRGETLSVSEFVSLTNALETLLLEARKEEDQFNEMAHIRDPSEGQGDVCRDT